MDEQFYEKLKEKILPYFENNDGHGFDHTNRVLKNALIISENENIDLDILKMACLLHDIARNKETDENGINHAELGAIIAKEILKEFGFPEDKIEKITYAIKVHRYSRGIKAEIREAEILQDADRLDALGAMVLVRMFQHAFKYNSPIYDPRIPVKEKYDGKKSTLINHIYEKILKIKPETFKTIKAKEIAKQRYKLVEDFVISFMDEWSE
ncbi:MAG: HD domain-containing protein [Nanoarchaeota archaeon]|nr:HD domain-containing protein [Nanoarchaeota archaeon]